MADWDRFFQILAKEDPHQRLRSIHNCRGFYDYTRPWVTHASLQTSDMQRGVEFRRQFNKPVIYDECKYEGDVPQGWGNLTAREMAERFWLGTLSGCYVGHGETYKHPEDILWWSKGGTLHGGSPARIQWIKAFLAEAPPFHELAPLGDTKGRYLLAKPGAYYLLYANGVRPQPLDLAGGRPYKVDLVDPWTMTVTPLGTQTSGPVAFTPPRAAVYRFTPYAPGEPLRPEASFTATPAAGRAPLEVRFAAPSGLKPRWDFGDGATSSEPSPIHQFTKPGLFTVTLTVTDAHGGSASAVREVLADRDSAVPILRLGVPDGESHALKLNGSAKRSEAGGYLFTDAAPWGWAETGVVDDLRGLRAFTLTGWLKPDNLTVGLGGNRILFCLQHNRDGIDLVCQADGRLRLAVNQWPDGVSNDSSPGRLVSGKWTRFAVAYDGTRDRDNVRWSFSAPLDAPAPAAALIPDRTTSHAAGPVGGDIGPLTVGNFNATLRSAGLDRQFRGEIRGLTLFGSRADASGALEMPNLPEAPQVSPPAGGALAGERFRVIVSTDIGGSDPDDFQSMVHYLVYADLFDTEGLVSSPPHAGRAAHIHETLDAYARDYPALKRLSGRYPTPDALRAVTKQGATDAAPAQGWSTPTEGSRWIVQRARVGDPRPLWVLVWGSITDVAQALHDAPEITPGLRVYSIGSWNTRMDPAARDYVVKRHPGLWLIEADTTFRGMYVGGPQEGDLGNIAFVAQSIKGHGALGDLFFAKKKDIKMGDTPSVLYLLRGRAEDPSGDHWGGAFVRRDTGPNHWTDDPAPALREKNHPGACTVNRWREAWLRDWQRRMEVLRR
jgi:PKD repeat protein